MSDIQSAYHKIISNTGDLRIGEIKRIIVLYEEPLIFIGDCCTRFDKFRYFKSSLNNAAISINFTSKKNEDFHKALLHNNPHIDSVSTLEWEDIDFGSFDAVFCIMYDEQRFMNFLSSSYLEAIVSDKMKLAVFSISDMLLKREEWSNYIFPVSNVLNDHIDPSRPGELYISKEEQEWADSWLRSNGYQEGEELFIIVDSSSTREKIMNTVVFFDLLKHLLKRPRVRLLVFDERNLGKQKFYQDWLGEEGIGKMIFSKGFSLRENLCMIGSSYTKMVFGPCTGLLHCASGIFNNYVNNGMQPEDLPVMITYTGQYTIENKNANHWWGHCPLINCIMLKKVNGRKTLLQLSDLTQEEKEARDTLPCSEYTTEILIDYIDSKLDPALSSNSEKINKDGIKQVLMLYEEELLLLGDSCIMFNKLRYLKEYLNNASLTVNFSNIKNHRFYHALLKNNPHVDKIAADAWPDIRFKDYDLVICVAYDEEKFRRFIDETYGLKAADGAAMPPVYSASEFLLKPVAKQTQVFPVFEELKQRLSKPFPGELYISREEQQWADSWLESKGLKKEEQLFIVIDSSAVRSKLLNANVYFDLLKGLLENKDAKILIFDERKQGKRDFYKGWLGAERMSRMIFSEGLSLREDLCLLGSGYTRLIVGPCTGLMHCASSIFNYYQRSMPGNTQLPLLVVYTGLMGEESYDINAWWGASPLVNCLLLKTRNGQKEMVLLNSLQEAEKRKGSGIPCSEYTAEMLLDFINGRLSGNVQDTFNVITEQTRTTDMKDLRNVLLLYEERTTLLGDSCIKSDKFKHFKSFLNTADIHINFTNKQNQKFYEGLLKHNPYLSSVTTLPWDDIRFEDYDAVISIAYNEDHFLEFLHNKYGERIAAGQMKLPVYSMSKHILRHEEGAKYIFPENEALFEYMKVPRQGELYITEDEQQWANSWLESMGVKKHEKLFILLDSSMVRSKLLNIDVYFDFLKYALSMKHTKVLIFDEQNMGKEAFYKEWLGAEAMEKLIFSKGLSLRQDLCLIGSGYTKIMFGPCTGLMHCASSIFNNYVSNGMNPDDVPLLVVYTGWYGKERYDVNIWWENSPLINCLLLKERNNEKEIVLLADLDADEREVQDSLPCTAYTADILKRFMDSKLNAHLPQLTT